MTSKAWLLVAMGCSGAFLVGCSSTTTSGDIDAGGFDVGTTDGARDAAPRDAARSDGGDAAPGDVDTGPGDVDTGPGDVDASTGDVDASMPPGDAATDAGPTPADAGIDAGPTPADGGTDAGNLPPSCTISAPPDGTSQAYDDDFVFVASASDPEDGPLSGASVVWRSDRIVAPLGSGLSVTQLLPPGIHVVTCTATDADGDTGTDAITVTSLSPIADIFHPGDGETRSAMSSVPFVGRGRDFEDGMLTGASLVWTSNLDGTIGTGEMFNRSLSTGTNVITLTVTDSDGNTGTEVITLTITP